MIAVLKLLWRAAKIIAVVVPVVQQARAIRKASPPEGVKVYDPRSSP